VTTGAYDTTYNDPTHVDENGVRVNDGGTDAFITKMDDDLTAVLASTFLGGPSSALGQNDLVTAIQLDPSGDVVVKGGTGASEFPTTAGAYETARRGPTDLFIARLDPDLATLRASTLLGGSGIDWELLPECHSGPRWRWERRGHCWD
jgi:hypothetical protein